MLAGVRPDETPPPDALRRAGVSPGLAAILSKCMQADPARRYADAPTLAEDLRRHLAHRPLRGVPNRSLGERWRKWLRRNPGTLRRLGVSALFVVTVAVSLFVVGRSILERRWAVEEVIAEARRLREQGNYAAAVRLLEVTPRPGGGSGVAARFDAELGFARQNDNEQRTRHRRAEAASELARLANRLRLGWDLGRLSAAQALALKRRCVGLWDRREELTATRLSPAEREELVEVALVLSALEKSEARLDEAEATLGREPVLEAERTRLRGRAAPSSRGVAEATAWENYWAGRILLRAGDTAEAGRRFAAAEGARPDAVWPCFYRGVCASRLGDHRGAERAFRVCEALLPHSAEVCVDRATALVGLDRLSEARACLDRAIALRPELGEAWYQRGVLSAREGNRPVAIADLERALAGHAPAGPTHYNLAVLYHERGRPKEAREHLRLALEAMPGDEEALRLERRIEKTSRER
jgi:tetratricopeptide (TPR) repeat protein